MLIDGDHRIDCQTLLARATVLAHAMLDRAPVGSVVSLMLPNWHEAVTLHLAALLAGMVVNPILTSLRDRELLFILRDVDSRVIFAPSAFRQYDYAAMLSRTIAQLSSPPEVVLLRGDARDGTPYETLVSHEGTGQVLPALNPGAVRMVLYTSGTTGRPKGVLHSHNSIYAMICQLRNHWSFEPDDALLVPSPVGHITGSFCAIEVPLLLGTTAVLMDKWNAHDACRLVDSERCTHLVGATPFLEQILGAARQAGTRLPSLRLFACGGASVPPTLVHESAAYFERAVVTRIYGLTEVPHITIGVTNRADAAHAADTDGKADCTEIKLVDHPAARTGEGEVYARGPQMLVGYLNPADEIGAFDSEGFFRTGDIARWVDGAYLVISGRVKDIIIRNGENISPKELEDLLIRHPGILEVAVIGLPDPRTGERACAVIVPKSHPGPDMASLRGFLQAEGLATFKFPEQVAIWNGLPKNDAGKILKHEIRAALTALPE
jgi:acyl-CoA synthetase (AMP-forming)/AMP-acid ligase II